MPDKPRFHRSPWMINEIEFVEKHYGSQSAREIGEKLGRSANGVARIAHHSGLGQRATSFWTEDLLIRLTKTYCQKNKSI